MKYIFIGFLFAYSSICSAQIIAVGDFKISKTTLNDFYKLSGYDTAHANIITTESNYESIWVKYYFDSVYHDTKIYSVNFDKTNLENFGWKLTAPTNAWTKVFYITQIPLKDYVANNILLTFYKNILTKIECDLPANLFDSLSLNNQHEGDSSTETKTLSKCVQAKSYNISKTVTVHNSATTSQSTLEYIEGKDAACKPYSHFNIKIINLGLWQQYLSDARTSLPATQQKLTNEYLNQKLQQLEDERNKKSKRKKKLL